MVLNVTYESSLTDLCEVNSSFDKGTLRICYTGENKNHSYLSRQVIEDNIPSIYNCPIVCNYDRETGTLGSHDVDIVRDKDGELRIINATQPVGLIPESAKVWFEDYEEEDGTIHEYLYAEALIWKRQEAYKKIKKDGITSHSMEITVKSGESIDGIYYINDFEFTAFALIGTEPCFESSALEMYSRQDFMKQLSEMMMDLKETIKNTMEGGTMALNEKKALAAEYGIDLDTLAFSINDFTIEELKEKFESMKNSSPDNKDTNKFALTTNIVNELVRTLETEKLKDEWGEYPRYCYADCDFDINEVYCWDWTDCLLYGFTYTINGDSITINFESKKRKKYIIVDFEENDLQASPFVDVFNLLKGKIDELKGFKEKFSVASDKIAALEQENEDLKKFKTETENAIAKQKRDEIFANFNDLTGIEAFEFLREHCMDYNTETIEEKCFAIRGRNNTLMKFSSDEKKPKLKVDKTDSETEPYGGLFIKYNTTNSSR